MAATNYPKTISTDFPNGKVATDRLALEIQSSSIVIALDRVDTEGDTCNIWFKDELVSGDVTTLDGLVAAHSGDPMPWGPPIDTHGVPIVTFPRTQEDRAPEVAQAPRLVGSECIKASHNLCRRETWWTESLRVTNGALTDSGDGLTWTSPHDYWIDLYHGLFYAEEELVSTHGVTVKVDGATKTMRDPFADDWSGGGDYYVDFPSGHVIFQTSQAGKGVTATYNYENGSGWVMAPSSGRVLLIEEAEINVSSDVVMNDTIEYLIQVYVPGMGWYTVGDSYYKTIWQMIQECRGNHPVVPAIGGAKRGTQHDVIQIPFTYVADRSLKSSDSVRLLMRLKNNVAFGGEHSSVTFYCLSREENGTE